MSSFSTVPPGPPAQPARTDPAAGPKTRAVAGTQADPLQNAQARPRIEPQTDPLRRAAQELETAFLAEMLKSAGLNETPEAFGGGPGEEQFQSLLVRAQAEQMVRSGGIGLAESLYHALKDH